MKSGAIVNLIALLFYFTYVYYVSIVYGLINAVYLMDFRILFKFYC